MYKISAFSNVRCGKHLADMSLRDYLREKIFQKGISYRDLARRSGDQISPSTVTDLLKGKNANPTVAILQALAKGLGVPEDEVFAAARGVKPPEDWSESRFFDLYEAYDNLAEERHKRRVLEDLEDLLTIIQAFPKKKADGPARVETIRAKLR